MFYSLFRTVFIQLWYHRALTLAGITVSEVFLLNIVLPFAFTILVQAPLFKIQNLGNKNELVYLGDMY